MNKNKDYSKMLFKAHIHFDGFERCPGLLTSSIKPILKDSFVTARNEFVDLFNSKIDAANDAYYEAYYEVIEPIYTDFIRKYFEKDFKKLNDTQSGRFGKLFEFYLDEEADIVARISYYPETKIWLTLELVE